MHAAELVEKKGKTLLLDVVGSSLGVGIAGGLVKPLIRKNSMLPCTVRETFYPGRDSQKSVRVPVVQGESRLAAENALLGELTLDGLGGTLRSDSPIEVTFAMNPEGLLSVSAVDNRSGKTQSVRIAARPVLAPQEAQRLASGEEVHRTEVAAMTDESREQNRRARSTLHEVLVALHRLHRQIAMAAAASADGEGKDVVESLGRRLVEAEHIEATGTPVQVLELATSLVELLKQVSPAGARAPNEDLVQSPILAEPARDGLEPAPGE
jgi:molecular chaperone DnaK